MRQTLHCRGNWMRECKFTLMCFGRWNYSIGILRAMCVHQNYDRQIYNLMALFDFGRLCVTYFTNTPFESRNSNIPSPVRVILSPHTFFFYLGKRPDGATFIHRIFSPRLLFPAFFSHPAGLLSSSEHIRDPLYARRSTSILSNYIEYTPY